jgi:nucleotide-binding universal stress UspA family protein
MRPTTELRLVVGYDGSPPAERALNAAVNLLQGRTGRIEVVYVAHMSSMAALSPAAVTELETDFDEIEQELRTAVGDQLRGRVEGWDFERREGLIAEELLAAAKNNGAAHPDATVVIVAGSSKAPKRCSKPKRPSMTRCGWPAPADGRRAGL